MNNTKVVCREVTGVR